MAECDCNNPVDDTSHIINLGTEIHVLKSQLEDAEKRADELQIKVAQLQAENERYREALEAIRDDAPKEEFDAMAVFATKLQKIAEQVLKG